MKKPKALRTPWGDVKLWIGALDFFSHGCRKCGFGETIPYFPSTELSIGEPGPQNNWFFQYGAFCPSCRPDLYVFEDGPTNAPEANHPHWVEVSDMIDSVTCNCGWTYCMYKGKLSPTKCNECGAELRWHHETGRVEEPSGRGSIVTRPAEVNRTVEPESPPESKPLRFVGHLKGCWATDRYKDNDHCGCWRIIKADYFVVRICESMPLFEIVGLPDSKLRSEWD